MSENIIQLFIRGYKTSPMAIDVHKDAQIADLYRKLVDKTGLEAEAIHLVFAGKPIEFIKDKDKHLGEFNMENKSDLCMVVRLNGGAKITRDQ